MPRTATRQTKPRHGGGEKGVAVVRERGISTTSKAGAALVSAAKPLTDQQRLFVKFWAQGESILSASLKAGYSDNGTYAYRMVYMPNILAEYQREKDAFERDSGMTRKKVIEGFLEGIDMAKTMAEPSSVIAGWREVGRMCGYYEPVTIKHQVSVEGKLMVDKMEKLSDQELLDLIEERMQARIAGQKALEGPETNDDDNDGADAGAPA